MRSIIFALAAACAFAAISAPASANENTRQEVRVSYADIDISTDRGADRLLRRINRAAQQVCGVSAGRVPIVVSNEYRRCIRNATDKAVAKTNNASVMSLYHERTGRSPQVTVAFLDRS